MKAICVALITACLAIGDYQIVDKLTFPLEEKDYGEWTALESAVLLRRKAVIVPELLNTKGTVHSNHKNSLNDTWQAIFDLKVGNSAKTAKSGCNIGLFYLRSISDQKRARAQYGYVNNYNGLGVLMNMGLGKEALIGGVVNDGSKYVNMVKEEHSLE